MRITDEYARVRRRSWNRADETSGQLSLPVSPLTHIRAASAGLSKQGGVATIVNGTGRLSADPRLENGSRGCDRGLGREEKGKKERESGE